MRVTLSMQADTTIGYLQTAASNLQAAQEKVTSGKQIAEPSDDPVGTGQAMRIQSTLTNIDQLTSNNTLAKSQLSATDTALQSITTQLQQLKTVATQAANTAVNDTTSNQGFITQIQGIEQSLVSLAGTKLGDNYLFSGFQTGTNPLTATPNGATPYTYQGDAGAVQIEVLPGQKLQTNATANSVFNLDSSAGANTKDIFSVISSLQTAIKTGNTAAISNSITDISTNLNNVVGINAQVGARLQQIDNNTTILSNTKSQMTDLLSSITNTDTATAAVNLQTQQNVYQAALAVAAKTMQVSLVDYLK